MTSAWDITAAVGPPRSVYVHAPLGHQTGRPNAADSNRMLVLDALTLGIGLERPGRIARHTWRWPENDGWEARAYTPESTPTTADGKPMRD